MIRFCTLLMAVWPFGLAAQEATVRGGEHPEFTRLVISFPAPTVWRQVKEEGATLFELDPVPEGFDLSRAFDLIPRTRLAGLEVVRGGAALRLDLVCDCTVTAFDFRVSDLVIDIANASRSTSSVVPGPDIKAPLGPVLTDGVVEAGSGLSSDLLRPAPKLHRRAPELWTLEPEVVGISQPEADTGVNSLPVVFDRPRSNGQLEAPRLRSGTTDLLAEGLARAASQGVVSVDPETGLSPLDTSREHSTPISSPNIRVRTRAEIDLGEVTDLIEELDRADCRARPSYDVAAWSDDADPWHAVGAARSGLFDGRDRTDATRIRRLVQSYLSLGFGLEAREVISAFDYNGSDKDLLEAIALSFEGDPVRAQTLFSQQVFCSEGPVVLGFITGASLNGIVADASEAFKEFSGWPLHLRRQLADEMIHHLLDRGHPDLAYLVFADFERHFTGDPGDIAHLRRAVEGGDPGTVGLDRRPREAVDFAAQLAQSDSPSPQELELLRAYQVEFRDTALRVTLDEAEFETLISTGQFGEAFARLDGREGVGKMRMAILEGVLGRGSDGDLLVYHVQAAQLPLAGHGAPIRQAYSDRLAAIGFPGLLNGVAEIQVRDVDPDDTAAGAARIAAQLAEISKSVDPRPEQLLQDAARLRDVLR